MAYAYKTETKYAFETRRGKITHNIDGRVTSNSRSTLRENDGYRFLDGKPIGHGHIVQIGQTSINKSCSIERFNQIYMNAQPGDMICEKFPLEFCTNYTGGQICCGSKFHIHEWEANKACMSCGVSYKLVQHHQANSRNLDGSLNVNNSNCAPVGDTGTFSIRLRPSRTGAHEHVEVQPKRAQHRRHADKILNFIQQIADNWPNLSGRFATEAKRKLECIYNIVHGNPEMNGDNQIRKMPSNPRALAAALFYTSVLQYDKETETGCELPAIIKYANDLTGRGKSAVTDKNVTAHLETLCSTYRMLSRDLVPVEGAFRPTCSQLSNIELGKDLLLRECTEKTIYCSKRNNLGIKLSLLRGKGLLQVTNASDAPQEIKKVIFGGDYIVKFQGEIIPVTETPCQFAIRVRQATNDSKRNFSIVIQRENKPRKVYRKKKRSKKRKREEE